MWGKKLTNKYIFFLNHFNKDVNFFYLTIVKNTINGFYSAMKRMLLLSGLLLLLLAACQKKAVPVITGRKATAPKKIESIYPPKETVAPDTLAGRRIFMNRCDRCHGLPLTAQFSIRQWDAILPTMMPRAGLSNEEAVHVRAYLLATATAR